MADFQQKQWLDEHVVPLLQGEPALEIHHPFWNGSPPKEVLVLVQPRDRDDPTAWGRAVHRLLVDDGFRFDLLRDQQRIPMNDSFFVVFGGDGAPLYNDEGFASVRLLRNEEKIPLILQVGHKFVDVAEASAAVKEFFALFKEDPLVVCQQFGSVFGQA